MSPDPLEPYMCRHGHLVLGCPHDDCPEQAAYVAIQHAAYRQYEDYLVERWLKAQPHPS